MDNRLGARFQGSEAASPASAVGAGQDPSSMGGSLGLPSMSGGASSSSAMAGPPPPFPFFVPSFDLALVGTAAFSAMAAIHIVQLFRTRGWAFIIIPQAALMLAVGMILRLVMISFPAAAGVLSMVSLLLLKIPGSLLPIHLMFAYTRLVWWTTPREHRNFLTLWLPPRASTLCLATSGAVGDVLTAVGSGQIVVSPGPRTASIGGIISMLVWILLLTLVARFTVISRAWAMSLAKRQGSFEQGVALSVSSFFIAVRGIVQVLQTDATEALIETKMANSIILTQEWPTWVFNFLPLFAVLAIQSQWHPASVLPRRLVGISLKTSCLLRDEEEGTVGDDLGDRGGGISGLVISRPIPNKDNANSVLVVSYDDQKYPVGYAA